MFIVYQVKNKKKTLSKDTYLFDIAIVIIHLVKNQQLEV
jgi:hypothetical protein